MCPRRRRRLVSPPPIYPSAVGTCVPGSEIRKGRLFFAKGKKIYWLIENFTGLISARRETESFGDRCWLGFMVFFREGRDRGDLRERIACCKLLRADASLFRFFIPTKLKSEKIRGNCPLIPRAAAFIGYKSCGFLGAAAATNCFICFQRVTLREYFSHEVNPFFLLVHLVNYLLQSRQNW